ncbi:MAG: hypothetical protein ACP5M4_05740 [Acidobacteriaceae bacterium]
MSNATQFNPQPGRQLDLRKRTASTKVTDEEFSELEAFARRQGKSMSEWIRETLFSAAHNHSDSMILLHVFTDVVGIQMLLMNALEPLLCGEKLLRDEVAARFRQVQKGKAAQAQELLNRRAQGKEN